MALIVNLMKTGNLTEHMMREIGYELMYCLPFKEKAVVFSEDFSENYKDVSEMIKNLAPEMKDQYLLMKEHEKTNKVLIVSNPFMNNLAYGQEIYNNVLKTMEKDFENLYFIIYDNQEYSKDTIKKIFTTSRLYNQHLDLNKCYAISAQEFKTIVNYIKCYLEAKGN